MYTIIKLVGWYTTTDRNSQRYSTVVWLWYSDACDIYIVKGESTQDIVIPNCGIPFMEKDVLLNVIMEHKVIYNFNVVT